MKSITFKYADQLSNWEWRTQHCVVESVEECKRIYGLGVDCEYEILEVKDINLQCNGCDQAACDRCENGSEWHR